MNALEFMAGLVVDDRGTRWGQLATDWQRSDAEAVLSEDPTAPRLHMITRPRGGSKTTDVAGMAIAAMLTQLPPHSRCYAAGADEEQAGRLVDAVRRFVAMTPGLTTSLRVDATRITVPARGTTLDALAADVAGSFGLLPDLIIVDELAAWPSTRAAREYWASLASAMAKRPRSRLVVITSAGSPAHWSAKVREQAGKSPLWRLSEMPGPLPWVSAEALAEQEALLLPSQFAQLHLNVWQDAEDRLTTVEDLRACVTLDGPQPPVYGREYVIGVDLGVANDRAAAAVMHRESTPPVRDGYGRVSPLRERVVLDYLAVWTPTRRQRVRLEDVEVWLRETARQYRGAMIVVEFWQAVGVLERLPDAGLRTKEIHPTQQTNARNATTLYMLITNRMLALYDDEELIDELANLQLVEKGPGLLRFDHESSRHDDRATAIALAATELLDAQRPVEVARIGKLGEAPGRSGWEIRFGPRNRQEELEAELRSQLVALAANGDQYARKFFQQQARRRTGR